MKIQARLKKVVIIGWVYFPLMMLLNLEDISEQALPIMQFGTMSVYATIIWLVSKVRLWVVDVYTLSILLFRCIITYLLFKFALEKQPGFEHIDIKQLQDSVVLAVLPFIICASVNWQIELFLTTPVLAISQIMTTMRAYSTDGDNMSCYA